MNRVAGDLPAAFWRTAKADPPTVYPGGKPAVHALMLSLRCQNKRTWWNLTITLLIAAALTATLPPPRLRAATVPSDSSSFLTWFNEEVDQRIARRDAAVDRLVADCMRSAGFDYVPSPASEPVPLRLFGSLDRGAAEQFGFARPGDGTPIGDGVANGRPDNPASQAAWYSALNGAGGDLVLVTTPGGSPIGEVAKPDGCVGAALSQLDGSADVSVQFSSAYAVLQQFRNDALAAAYSSDAVANLSEAWRACLAGRGIVTTGRIGSLGSQDWPEPRPTAGERAAAVADVECRVSLDAEATALAPADAYVQEHYETYRSFVDLVAAELDRFDH